ncbi:MAG: hypothetical protein AMXMBFR57_22990 [Acidimicrobiia bacterium]
MAREAFLTALDGVDLHTEVRNPFVLNALLETFASDNALPPTRTEAVRKLVDRTLASNPTSDPALERRALRMLAMAMETYARNELSLDDAAQVLMRSTVGVSQQRATTLLDELSRSILIRTPKGISFQMRSFGEYLAAEELSDRTEPLRSLELMFVPGKRILGVSWLNAATFLAELHSGFRGVLARSFPEAVLRVTPSRFSSNERRAVAQHVFNALAGRRESLVYHPSVSAERLARFVDDTYIERLRTALDSKDEVEVGNAALLLAAARDTSSADRLLTIGLDVTRASEVRRSALALLGWVGTPSMVPALLAVEDENLSLLALGAAVTLMDASQFGDVFRGLASRDVTITAAWERFSGVNTSTDAMALLNALAGMGAEAFSSRMSSYLSSLWRAAARNWIPEMAPVLAALVGPMSSHGSGSSAIDDLVKALKEVPDQGASVGARLVEYALNDPQILDGLDFRVFPLVDLPTAIALRDAHPHSAIVGSLRVFGIPTVRAALQPPTSPLPLQDAQTEKWARRQAELEAQKKENFAKLSTATSGTEVVNALAALDRREWPELAPAQVAAVREAVGQFLVTADLRNRIVWKTEHSWQVPQGLNLALAALDRYGFKIPDERPLAWALLGHEAEVVLRYHHRHGLSSEALEEARLLVENDGLVDEALLGVLRFWSEARIDDDRAIAAAARIAGGQRKESTRERALDVVTKNREDNAVLSALLPELSDDLRERLEVHLMKRGHRPTAERRLSALLSDPTRLAAGDTESPFDNPLQWIAGIRNPALWKKLVRLRKLALEQANWGATHVISSAMEAIDPLRLADVIEKQVLAAATDAQPFQRRQARELRDKGTILAMQSLSLDDVLKKMALATTLNRFIIWVEGENDIPAVEKFITEVAGDRALGTVVDSLGGWNHLFSPSFRAETLWRGCHDLMVLLDGDAVRDFSKSDRPLSAKPEVKRTLKTFRDSGIEPTILIRYAIENYFSQEAFERHFGTQPPGVFPLDDSKPVEDQVSGFAKSKIGDLARATNLADLEGTDLGEFFQAYANRV